MENNIEQKKLLNIDGAEIYRIETMEYDNFQDNTLYYLQCEVYPQLDDEMMEDLIYDIIDNMSGEAVKVFKERMYNSFRQHKNLLRREARQKAKEELQAQAQN